MLAEGLLRWIWLFSLEIQWAALLHGAIKGSKHALRCILTATTPHERASDDSRAFGFGAGGV
jgi:hypothetical protein